MDENQRSRTVIAQHLEEFTKALRQITGMVQDELLMDENGCYQIGDYRYYACGNVLANTKERWQIDFKDSKGGLYFQNWTVMLQEFLKVNHEKRPEKLQKLEEVLEDYSQKAKKLEMLNAINAVITSDYDADISEIIKEVKSVIEEFENM